MKNRILKTAICAAALLGSTYSTSLLAATANGAATAVVTAPLTLAPNTGMDVGKFTPGASGGTIQVVASDSSIVLGGTVLATGGIPAAATFDVTAENLTPYTVSYGNGILSDGTNTMAIAPDSNTASGTGTGAIETFAVGATITVGTGQVAGTYTTALAGGAPFTVTVNY